MLKAKGQKPCVFCVFLRRLKFAALAQFAGKRIRHDPLPFPQTADF
jgi:hypothetical protein